MHSPCALRVLAGGELALLVELLPGGSGLTLHHGLVPITSHF